MPRFSYQAINESGTTVTGVIEAESAALAKSILADRGYIPSRVVEGKNHPGEGLLSRLNSHRIRPVDLILFTKQFRSMLNAGIPIIRLFEILVNQTENKALNKTIAAVSHDVQQGATLYTAMSRHPRVFSPVYLSMVAAGEVSGTMPEVLSRLTYIIEHEAKVKADIRSALQYPIIVLVALTIAFFTLLTLVIPKFVTIFSKAGLELPFPTQMALFLYKMLENYWFFLLGGAVALIVGLKYFFRTEQGKLFRDTLLLKIPVLGPLLIKSAMSRFASIFAILKASGVTVMQSMSILSGTVGNHAISRTFERVTSQMEGGQGISGPLKSAKYFTPMIVDMIAIGEETGNIDEMLREISAHYDDEIEYAVKELSTAVGPVLVVCLAAVVGFFALAIFMPMWDLTKMVK